MNYDRNSKHDINIKKWERLRDYILVRDLHLDQELLRYGKRVGAKHVHHIFPREYFPEWTYEPWNLISVSLRTHNELHDRDSHKLTEKGWRLLVRTANKNGIPLDDNLKDALVETRSNFQKHPPRR